MIIMIIIIMIMITVMIMKYICVYVYVYIYIYTHIHTYIHTYIHVCTGAYYVCTIEKRAGTRKVVLMRTSSEVTRGQREGKGF